MSPFEVFEQQIQQQKSEVKGLKEAFDIVQDHLVKAEQQIRYKDALIVELVDALEEEFGESRTLEQNQKRPWDIIKRAKEMINRG